MTEVMNLIQAINYMSEDNNNMCIAQTNVQYTIFSGTLHYKVGNGDWVAGNIMNLPNLVNYRFNKLEDRYEEVQCLNYLSPSPEFKKPLGRYTKDFFKHTKEYQFMFKEGNYSYYSKAKHVFRVKH